MGIKIKSTKSFRNLPCGHGQWFDMTPDRKPGTCASVHGYDREITFTFAGEIDEYGWVYPFGNLKEVKKFLEHYFDHTTVLGADDPRLENIPPEMLEPGQILGELRVLPYGVSMEMSSLFIWECVNPYIYHMSGGRVYVEKVESREHERNSAMIEVDEDTAKAQAQRFKGSDYQMPNQLWFEFTEPKKAVTMLEDK